MHSFHNQNKWLFSAYTSKYAFNSYTVYYNYSIKSKLKHHQRLPSNILL